MSKILERKWYISLAILALVAGLFNFFSQRNISYAELNYSEYSDVLGESGGAIIPASCESSPPTNHGGDCPVNVQTGIQSRTNEITANLTAPRYSLEQGEQISWTSTGATFCATSWTSAQVGPSGSYTVTGPACSYLERTYSIRCYDGVFWSDLSSVTVAVWGDRTGCITGSDR